VVKFVAGTRLGPYQLLSAAGAGGMGEVYRARDTRLDRIVAIKVLPAHISSDPNQRRRLGLEARVLSGLNHPNICSLYDVGNQDGVDFLVMEYLEGETLADRLHRGPLPTREVLRYGVEIADALEKAHRQGLIHRDLKPANIMLTSAGAKLLDFGLAKVTGSRSAVESPDTESLSLSNDGMLLGTLQYMSPEQIECKEAGPQSDIFALGLVLYEMVTGQRASAGDSQVAIAGAIVASDPLPITTLQPTAPRDLERIIKACLAKKPDDRWQSVHDLKVEVQWLQERLIDVAIPQPTIWHARSTMLSGAAGIVIFLAALTLTVTHHRTALPVQAVAMVRSSLLPPAKSSFLPYNFAISPDGTHLAFVALGQDGRNVLWVRALSTITALQLSGTDDAMFPFWSPESRRIGFFADGKLKTIDIAGVSIRILCEALIGRGGTWNRDGTILFAPFISGPLYRIPAEGGTATPVTAITRKDSGQAHRWPFFLPDGKHFLYFVDTSSPGDPNGNGIYAGSLDSGETKLISSELGGNVAFASGNLLYVRDRSLMAQPFNSNRLETTGPAVPIAEQEIEKSPVFSQWGFSVSQTGVLVFQSAADAPSRLVWFDSTGKELGQLPDIGYKDPSISPDGRYVALSSDDEHNGKRFIRVYDLVRGISTRLTEGGSEEFPIWTHRGEDITYAAAGGSEIRHTQRDGSGLPQLLLRGSEMVPTDWSGDGHLAFMDRAIGRPHLTFYSLDDQKVRQSPMEGAEVQFSPDAKWVAYTVAGKSVHPTVFVEPFPGSEGRIQICSEGSQPRWSRDGRQIFYIAPDRKLMSISFDSRRRSASTPRVLFQTRIVAPDFALLQYDVAPDGHFLINSFPSSSSSPLTLLTNWNARPRAR